MSGFPQSNRLGRCCTTKLVHTSHTHILVFWTSFSWSAAPVQQTTKWRTQSISKLQEQILGPGDLFCGVSFPWSNWTDNVAIASCHPKQFFLDPHLFKSHPRQSLTLESMISDFGQAGLSVSLSLLAALVSQFFLFIKIWHGRTIGS